MVFSSHSQQGSKESPKETSPCVTSNKATWRSQRHSCVHLLSWEYTLYPPWELKMILSLFISSNCPFESFIMTLHILRNQSLAPISAGLTDGAVKFLPEDHMDLGWLRDIPVQLVAVVLMINGSPVMMGACLAWPFPVAVFATEVSARL